MKKSFFIFFYLIFFINCLFFANEKINLYNDFSLLDINKSLLLQKKLFDNDLIEEKYKWLPKVNLNLGFAFKASYNESDFVNQNKDFFYTLNPNIQIVQNLLGGSLLYLNFNTFSSGNNKDFFYLYNMVPSIKVCVPLIFDKELLKINNESFINKYKISKSLNELNYELNLRENLFEVISYIGDYLYYKEYDKYLKEKKQFLEEKINSFNKLIIMGKISFQDFSNETEELLDCEKDIIKNKEIVLSLEKKIISLGLDTKKIEYNIEDFIYYWFNFYNQTNSNESISKKYEKNYLEYERINNVRNNVLSLPEVSFGLNFENKNQLYFKNIDFTNYNWNASFAVNIPITKWNVFSLVNEKNKTQEELYRINLSKIKSEEKLKIEEFIKKKELQNEYINETEKHKYIEENRYFDYKKLYEMGKISELQVKNQKLNTDLVNLYFIYSKLEYIKILYSFY